MNIFVIIPAYNESCSIADVVVETKKHYPKVVVIDDGSNDDTKEKARAAGATVLRHMINRGQGAALQTGTDYALKSKADIIVHFDADGQMEVGEIQLLVDEIQKKSIDIALGSRFLKKNNIPLFKNITHKMAVQFHWLVTGIRLSDIHCGFRALSRYAAQKIQIRHDRMAHATEIEEKIAQNDLKYSEVPVTVHYTEYSKKKALPFFTHAWQVLRDLLIGKII